MTQMPPQTPMPKPAKPFYKKWWFIVLAIVVVLGILAGALGGGDEANNAASPAASTSGEAAGESPEAAEDQGGQEAGSDYAVTIKGSSQVKDYDGAKALVVDFTFTNNSDEPQSFLGAISAKAFQNGVELDTAIVADSDKYDSGASMKEIKPGATVEVQDAYVLEDSSEVTVEVTDMWTWDDTELAKKTFTVK